VTISSVVFVTSFIKSLYCFKSC